MDKIVSFIIPSYNVEKYLNVCLTSFLNPEVLDQIEVIVVDDGSRRRKLPEHISNNIPRSSA